LNGSPCQDGAGTRVERARRPRSSSENVMDMSVYRSAMSQRPDEKASKGRKRQASQRRESAEFLQGSVVVCRLRFSGRNRNVDLISPVET
jgi:hypothetical protein